MGNKVIIPTDYSIESLNILKQLLTNYPDTQLDVIFVHGYTLNDGIRNLLFHSKSRILSSLCPEEFDEALNIIKNKFPNRIVRVQKELFHGFTQASFNNFIEGAGAFDSFISPTYAYKFKNKNSFSLNKFITKCSQLTKHEISWSSQLVKQEDTTVAELFLQPAPAMN